MGKGKMEEMELEDNIPWLFGMIGGEIGSIHRRLDLIKAYLEKLADLIEENGAEGGT